MKHLFHLFTFAGFLFMSAVSWAQGAGEGASPAAPGREQGLSQTLIMIAIALFFFYFIMWRPEKKRRKALEQQRGSVKKGDRITAMGILGTVVKVQEETLVMKLYDGAKMEILKAAVSDVQPGGASDKASEEVEDSAKRVELNPTK